MNVHFELLHCSHVALMHDEQDQHTSLTYIAVPLILPV